MLATIRQIASAVIVLALMHGLAQAQSPAGRNDQAHYATGRRVAECLAQGCVGFTAILNKVEEPTLPAGEDPQRAMVTRKLAFTIVEWLYGNREQVADAIELVHSARPALTRLSEGPWTAWENFPLQPGTLALIVRRCGPSRRPDKTDSGALHDEVIDAAANADLIFAMRDAIAHYALFESADVAAVESDPLMDRAADAFIAGYLANWLTGEVGVDDADAAAHRLTQLLSKPPLAVMAVYEITDWLTSVFYRLSGPIQDEVTGALANAGSGSDRGVAVAALRSLIRLSDEKLANLLPFLSQPVSQGLIDNYRKMDAEHSAGAELRKQLGLEQ